MSNASQPPPLPPLGRPLSGEGAPWAPPIAPGQLGKRPHRAGLILPFGITSLVLSVLGPLGGFLFAPCCGMTFVGIGLAIPAWVMASTDLRMMDSNLMDPSGRSQTVSGRTCAIIAVVLSGVTLVLTFLLLVLGIGAAVLTGMSATPSGR